VETPHAEGLEKVPASTRRRPARLPTPRADTATLQTKVDLARNEIGLGRLDNAQQTLTDVLDEIPALPLQQFREHRMRDLATIEGTAASLLGQVLTQRTEMGDQAMSALSRAVTVLGFLVNDGSSANAQVWADYGVALDLLGRPDEAMLALIKAFDLGDASRDTSQRLARLLIRTDRPADAEPILRRTLVSGPADVVTLRLLGDVLRSLDRSEEAGRTYFDGGVEAVFGDQLPQALELFQAAAELLPSDPDTQYAVGEILRRLDRTDEALDALERALALQPTHPRALASKGDVLRVKGNPDGALLALDAALATQRDAFALATKGDVLRAQGDYEGAVRALDESLSLRPDDGWAVGTRGQVLRALDRLPEARDNLRRAVELAPDLSWAWAELAATEYSLGDLDQALATAAVALEQDPDNPLALAVTGLGHIAAGRFAEAEPALRKLSAVLPGEDWVWTSLARAREPLGDDEGALAAADRALHLAKDNPEALAVRGIVLLRRGQPERAVAELERYVEGRPDDPQGWQGLAQACAETGDHVLAVQAYERALRLRSDDPDLLVGKARSLIATGDTPAAFSAYEQALRQAPASIDLLEELTAIAGETGTQAEAVAILLRIGPEHPAGDDLRRNQARLEFQLGRYDDLEQTLRGIDPVTETAEDSWLRGEAARRQGRAGDATRAFKRALEMDPDYLPAMTSLVHLNLEHDRIARARQYAERAVQTAGDNAPVLTDLALVDLAEDQFEDALSRVERALDQAKSTSDRVWALETKARILSEQGEFQAAVPLLEPVDELTPDGLGVLGWCRENAALQRAADETPGGSTVSLSDPVRALVAAAYDAYERGRRLQPLDVRLRRGVADTLDLLKRHDEARGHYEAIVAQLSESGAYDANTIALLGWCYYALSQHERAIGTYVSALSTAVSKDMLYLHLDLALATLAAGSAEQAVTEYRRAVRQVAHVAAPRRRARLLVARNDLTAARVTGRVAYAADGAVQGSVTQVMEVLEDALTPPA
jgi:tetratricopeptide (TPR) repeat protein